MHHRRVAKEAVNVAAVFGEGWRFAEILSMGIQAGPLDAQKKARVVFKAALAFGKDAAWVAAHDLQSALNALRKCFCFAWECLECSDFGNHSMFHFLFMMNCDYLLQTFPPAP
jgi:hypothetical protein